MKQNELYAAEIADHIMELFNKESENFMYDANKVDGTAFFTGLIKASALIFDKFTGDGRTFLEFTHLANQLIVQDMMESKEDAA